jgi:hypothetical protein
MVAYALTNSYELNRKSNKYCSLIIRHRDLDREKTKEHQKYQITGGNRTFRREKLLGHEEIKSYVCVWNRTQHLLVVMLPC